MKAKWCILAVLVFSLVAAHSVSFAAQTGPTISYNRSLRFQGFSTYSSDGELGFYLIGTWDHGARAGGSTVENVITHVTLVNPTSVTLGAFVTFWAFDETPLTCDYRQISPNGTNAVERFTADLSSYTTGAIKVLVVGDTVNAAQPEIGMVGYRKEIRQISSCQDSPTCALNVETLSVSEIRLQPVPWKVLNENYNTGDAFADEILAIKAACGQ